MNLNKGFKGVESAEELETILKQSDLQGFWMELIQESPEKLINLHSFLRRIQPTPYFESLLAAFSTLLNTSSFQVQLMLNFEVFARVAEVLIDWSTGELSTVSIHQAEAFTNGCIQHSSTIVFLHGLVWLKTLLWSGIPSFRAAFIQQILAQITKSAAYSKSVGEVFGRGKDALTRYSLLLVTATTEVEFAQVFTDLGNRREFVALETLAKYVSITEASFLQLVSGITAESPPELFSAVFHLVEKGGRELFSQGFGLLSIPWIGFIGKLWKSYQGRIVPTHLLLPLISYLQTKSVFPESGPYENEGKALIAALSLVASSIGTIPGLQLSLECCKMIQALGKVSMEGEHAGKFVALVGKVVASVIRSESGLVKFRAFSAAKTFAETTEILNISGLIPDSHSASAMSYFETGVLGDLPSEQSLRSALEKHTSTEAKTVAQIRWPEVVTQVQRLQTTLGLQVLQVSSEQPETLKMQVLKALEDVKGLIST